MTRRNVCALTLAVSAIAGLAGCQLLGPNAISGGRDRYNSIIATTSMEQTMSNIVRVYQHQPTLFMDVTEVDAVSSFVGNLGGAATNIGAKPGTTGSTISGRLGSASGAVQYSETPTVRYQPLLGQALVAQLVTPVSVDALGLLYDSSWPAAPLLDFAAAYLTLDYDEFYSALNTIMELDANDALELSAAKSDLPKPPEVGDKEKPPSSTKGSAGPKSAPSGNDNDALVIYLRPFHPHATSADMDVKRRVLQLWIRLLRIYARTQPAFEVGPQAAACKRIHLSVDEPELTDWDVNISDPAKTADQLDFARNCLPSSIELRVVSAPAPVPRSPIGKAGKKSETAGPNLVSRAPLMRTYSALGILKAATERPHPKVEFVTPDRYREIRDATTHPWNGDTDSLSYYTLLPQDEDSIDCPGAGSCDNPPPEGKRRHDDYLGVQNDLAKWLQESAGQPQSPAAPSASDGDDDPYHGLYVYENKREDVLKDLAVRYNQRLGLLRRYMLIIVDDRAPASAYVAYSDRGRSYYIAGDDAVSQKNFHLLSLFLTMMAVPPSTQPLSPVINVGG
jgi:hypothetical protein